MADQDRRNFLKLATCALGGGVGLVTVGPVLRFVADPDGTTTVTSPKDPIDVGDAARFKIGGPPMKVDVVAPVIQNAWATSRDVLLGAAWVRATAPGQLVALSAVCPHLGCAIGWDGGGSTFVCPCHDSKFGSDGSVMGGPSKRAMDELPVQIVNGRLMLTWKRFRADTKDREEV
jgi:menaquinol-cytochrome c reductase iron-sulfur subunit|nr:Rieske 2Fe-2S domain-containing protein [Kofleriaceae bacterium]